MTRMQKSGQEKATIGTTVRADVRLVATLTHWLEIQGSMGLSLSSVMHSALEILANIITQEKPGLEFQNITEAVEFLKARGMIRIQAKNKSLARGLSLESALAQAEQPGPAQQPELSSVMAMLEQMKEQAAAEAEEES